jgi:tRNA (mo5U34)-methyltransferase
VTIDEIRAGIERLAPWFHQIELAPHLLTKQQSVVGEPADHPRPTWNIIKRCLPADLTVKSVLDVGCNAGFYSVEAKRRHAARVLGVDASRRAISQAKFVNQALGMDMEFRRLSVYDVTRDRVGQFDVVLALGLIYHLKHLVLALENLFSITRELLILETAALSKDEVASVAFKPRVASATLHPLAYVENSPDAAESVFNWFIPSVGATVALLKNVGFAEVSVVDVSSGRAVLACRRDPTTAHLGVARLAAHLAVQTGPTQCRAGEWVRLVVKAENKGYITWTAQGEAGSSRGMVRLGAHLLSVEDDEISWDYGRVNLPHDIAPGETVTLELIVPAPTTPGHYKVEFDMLAEHLAWFEDFGSPILTHKLEVTAG